MFAATAMPLSPARKASAINSQVFILKREIDRHLIKVARHKYLKKIMLDII